MEAEPVCQEPSDGWPMAAPEERSAGLFPLSAPHVPSAGVLWPNIWSKQPQEERRVWADREFSPRWWQRVVEAVLQF